MGFFTSLKSRLLLIGALLAGVAGVIFSLRRSAMEAGRTEVKVKNLEQVLNNVVTKNEVTREIKRMPVGDLNQRLRDKWSRD
jgi:hypothetical protein